MTEMQFCYKGYWTEISYSKEDRVYHGRLEGIRDVVNFEAKRKNDCEKEFRKAVDNYIRFCASIGEEPDVPTLK